MSPGQIGNSGEPHRAAVLLGGRVGLSIAERAVDRILTRGLGRRLGQS